MPAILREDITYIQVEDSAVASGLLAHNFFGHPSEKLKLMGVTGTNGKTTIVTLLYKLFSSLGYTMRYVEYGRKSILEIKHFRLHIQHLTRFPK